MDSKFTPDQFESMLYRRWENAGSFRPGPAGQEPFSILLPPPNANDSLHVGHAMFVIEDLLIRYHRMQGNQTVWFPGTDHAGIETQFVFEKMLAKKGQSRFQFDRNTLYQQIRSFVEQNRGLILKQLRLLGLSLDWEREKYTLAPAVEKLVFRVFQQLHREKLAYRAYRLVNYCTKCGTSFSNLEVKYIDQVDPLYYLKYGPFVLATVRPETKFGDTAVAVHPKDKRYQKWVGKVVEAEGLLGKFKIKVIADEAVDPKFGTGVVKVTPAHDFTDFEIGQRHKLEIRQVIDYSGRLNKLAGPYAGLRIKAAREKTVADLQTKGLIEKIDYQYTHRIGACYRCRTVIEPLPLTQWFVKTSAMIEPVKKAVATGETTIIPRRFVKIFRHWADNYKDWNISRQIAWGFRIPVWYSVDKNPQLEITFLDPAKNIVNGKVNILLRQYSLADMQKGLQSLIAPAQASFVISQKSPGPKYLQETDTFDTWFSSSLWPLICTDYPQGRDFKDFYPTDVLDTGHDILPFWVMRMMIMGKYLTGKSPFKTVYLHSMVVDKHGQKMSKSKGNVVSPLGLVNQYGADALRMALLVGSAPGNPIALSEEKVKGYRNFANKLWNIGRFTWMQFEKMTQAARRECSGLQAENSPGRGASKEVLFYHPKMRGLTTDDRQIIKELNSLIKKVTNHLNKFRFSQAGEITYHFTWHRLADWYLETIKDRLNNNDVLALSVLRHVLLNCLKLLHPFMPFVTEAVWGYIPKKKKDLLIVSAWPK